MSRGRGPAIALAVAIGTVALAAPPGRPARAAPGSLVTAPAGWRPDPEQEAELARRFAAVGHFGGLPATTAAEVHVPARSSVALFATRATAALPDPAAAAGAARAALDELRATTRRAALTGGAAEEQAWQERTEAEARQVTAILHWREPASHTVGNARIVVVSDGRRIAAVTGECLAGDGADRAATNACIDQLASLDPGIPPADRVALAAAPPAGEPGAAVDRGAAPSPASAAASAPASAPASASASAAAAPAATMAPAPDSQDSQDAMRRAPPRLDDGARDGRRIVLPPMVIRQDDPADDRRPAYIGAGLIVLAVAFWWSRRQRDRFEREDGIQPPRARRARRTGAEPDRTDGGADGDADPGRPADDDADDLRAAACGDRPDPPEAPTGKPSP